LPKKIFTTEFTENTEKKSKKFIKLLKFVKFHGREHGKNHFKSGIEHMFLKKVISVGSVFSVVNVFLIPQSAIWES